jgi:hypothetical protein
VVVVVAPVATTVIVVTALVETKKLVSPEYDATTVCAPPVEKLVVVTAMPPVKATGGPATLSTVKVTVPVGAVVPELGATVAVIVTVTPTAGLAGEATTVVVDPSLVATELNAVANLLTSNDPSPVAWSYPVPAE